MKITCTNVKGNGFYERWTEISVESGVRRLTARIPDQIINYTEVIAMVIEAMVNRILDDERHDDA